MIYILKKKIILPPKENDIFLQEIPIGSKFEKITLNGVEYFKRKNQVFLVKDFDSFF